MLSDGLKAPSPEDYLRRLRSPARALWAGVIDASQFFEAMTAVIERGLNQAWREGAAECGVQPGDYTPAEEMALAEAIVAERAFVTRLAEWIATNSKANGGKVQPVFDRLTLWANRYRDARNQAKLLACADQKLEWVLGPTEHCSTCSRLAGRVKRGSQWQAAGLRPQNPPNEKLECGGYHCQCELKPTTKPVSRGKLPVYRKSYQRELLAA